MIRRRFIYDIEIFPNFFYILFYDILNKKYFDFKLSDYENNIAELVKFLSQDNILLIGFNNLKFDWPLLDYILFLYKKGYSISPSSIKQKANQLIKSSRKATNPSVLQCDLLLLNHFDNKAKIVSLKDLEFSMRMMNVQELPYPHNKILTLDEINTVKSYCYNDIDATYKLYEKSEKLLNGRFSLSYQYKTDMLSFNDPKVGEFILLDKLRKKLKKDYLGQTIRESIDISNIVFPYIEFQSEAFINLLEWLKQRTITDTKGMFTAIPLEEIEVLQPNINIVKYKKEYLKKLNVVYKGFEFTFGVGGIHGAEKGYFESNDEYVIKTCDVSSLYPNISIENNLYPEHLGNTFCEVYYNIYKERQKYNKGTPENLSLKLSLNGYNLHLADVYTILSIMKGVYSIKNIRNKKQYIGSSVDVEKRIQHHKYMLKNNKHKNYHLQYAWNKYGENSFEFVILEICKNTLEREQFYIDSQDFEDLYNINPLATGGDQFPEEVIKRRSETTKRRYANGELDYVKDIIRSRIPWNKGKKYESTDHLKVPKTKKGDRSRDKETKRNRLPMIRVFDRNMIFLDEWRSAKDLEEESLTSDFKLIPFMTELRNPKGRQGYSPYFLSSSNMIKSSKTNTPYKGFYFKHANSPFTE